MPASQLQSTVIAPSILSANFARLGEEVDNVLRAGADWVHFDVMDNHYVPNLTIGPLVCEALRKHGVTAPIDVHLMVKPVDRIIPDFAKAGATSWQVDARSNGLSVDEDDLDFAWGVGIQARIWSLGARLEYEQFPIVDDEKLDTISLSFTYTFL